MKPSTTFSRLQCAGNSLFNTALFVLAMLLSPSASWAGGVVTNCTEADLRAAMAGGGTVTFACDGTIILTNTISNIANTVLDAAGRQIAISSGTQVRAFYVSTNTSLTLADLTITGGSGPDGVGSGGITNAGGTLTIINANFQGNVVVNGGGGAIFNRGGLVNATNCIFTGNSGLGFVYSGPPKEAHGGAILNQGGQVNLENCVFAGNQAWGSMGTMNVDWGGDGIGGAVENSGILSLNRCTFVRNSAKGGDGWDSSRYANGAAGLSGGTGKGGAIFNSGSLAIANSSFFSNSVAGGKGGGGAGGAVGYYPPWQDGGPGGAGASGGSAYGADLFNQGAASAVNSTFAWNTASAGAGGAGGYGGRALLHGDPAPAGGPGNGGSAFGTIYGGAFLGNCTLAFNSATNGAAGAGGGGGIGNGVPNGPTGGSGTAGLAGGGLADAVCRNAILASNVPGGNCRGGNSDQGNNLSSDAACSFSGAGSLNNVDPKLGALANNGGPTLTLALLPGSPAIDAGNTASAPATDQRGFPRPAGAAADIGAFEYGSVMPTLNLSQSSATALDLLVRGNSNQWCRVLTSTNLRDWICVATNQIGGEGTLLLHDSCASGKACMYYRLIMP